MGIHIEGIEALEAIVECGSFSAAADRLHKAQSAVSYAVEQLEAQLGVQLFDRSGYRAELTEAGRLVLEEGRELLTVAHRIEHLAERIDEDWEPQLQVVVDGILPMAPVMDALEPLVREEVPTQIQVKVEFLGGVQFRFEEDGADFMLVKEYEPGGHLQAEPLGEVTSVLVVSPDHPLAELERVSVSDLHEHVELTIQDSSAGEHLEPLFGGSRIFYLSDFETKLRAVERGLGFGWIPKHMIGERLERGELIELPYEGTSRFSFSPVLVRRKDEPLGRCGRRLVENLHSHFGTESGT